MKCSPQDNGVAAVWTAAALVFLLGSAALAVDMSGFWQQARVQQTAADLACLAGVRHAPVDRDEAVTKAAEYLRPNAPGLRPLSTTPDSTIGNTSYFSVGDFTVEIETPFDDGNAATRDDALMRVTVLQTQGTTFGRVLGSNEVTIVQDAHCQAGSPLALGDLPLALDATGLETCENTGGGCVVKIEEGNDCVVVDGPGACGSIDVPRHDDPPGTGTSAPPQGYIYNLALGTNWDLAAPGELGHGDNCTGGAEPCGWLKLISGVKPNHVTDGMIRGINEYSGRLVGPAPHNELPYPNESSPSVHWDAHQLADAASCNPSQIAGDDCGGDTTESVDIYRVLDCREPRWSGILVVQDFDPDLYHEYLGSRFAWIQEPDMAPDDPNQISDPVHAGESEFASADKVQFVAVRILRFPLAENTPVDNAGECGFHEFVEGAPSIVRLIEP